MKFLKGNLFYNYDKATDILLATGNSYIKLDKSLVMGAGSALEMKKLFPGCQYKFSKGTKHLEFYGVMLLNYNDTAIGLFQTKYHFKDDSTIELISKSLDALKQVANNYTKLNFRLPFPGISNGGLIDKKEEIAEMLKTFPDNVTVYEL